MKEDSFSKPGFKPTIDRNSKVAAVSLYQARQKPLEDILVEHEQILDKSKQNALDIINTEKELQNLEQQEPSDAGLDETQESLLFEVMQLKDRQRDYVRSESLSCDPADCNRFVKCVAILIGS